MNTIEPEHHNGTAATDCMAFVASMEHKYKELLRGGDMVNAKPRWETLKEAADKYSKVYELMTEEGLNTSAACEEVGVSSRNFRVYASRHGWELPNVGRPVENHLSDGQVEEIKKLREFGATWVSISKRLNVNCDAMKREYRRKQIVTKHT